MTSYAHIRWDGTDRRWVLSRFRTTAPNLDTGDEIASFTNGPLQRSALAVATSTVVNTGLLDHVELEAPTDMAKDARDIYNFLVQLGVATNPKAA